MVGSAKSSKPIASEETKEKTEVTAPVFKPGNSAFAVKKVGEEASKFAPFKLPESSGKSE